MVGHILGEIRTRIRMLGDGEILRQNMDCAGEWTAVDRVSYPLTYSLCHSTTYCKQSRAVNTGG